MHGVCVEVRGQPCALGFLLSYFFMSALGLKLRASGFCGKHLYPPELLVKKGLGLGILFSDRVLTWHTRGPGLIPETPLTA